MKTQEKVAIVTGAGGGIGRAVAARLARDGMHVVLVDQSEAALASVAELLAGEQARAGGALRTLRCQTDVGSESAVAACIEQVLATFGRSDVLVNNAGISPKKADGAKAYLTEISLAEWEQVMRVNLTSVFLMCRAAIPALQAQPGSAIVSISSSAALDGGILAASHYSASKGAVSALTRTLARELAPSGVRVNAVAPGRVATPMAKLSSDERNRAALARIPIGRFAEADEIADSVAYLASAQASYTTGVTLNVSGGYVMN